MLYCPRCQKEVILYGVSLGAVPDDALEKFAREMEQQGKIVLFNPPPLGNYQCPYCSSVLQERAKGTKKRAK